MAAKKKKNDNYFENLGKEFAQFMRAKDIANETENRLKYMKSRQGTDKGLSVGSAIPTEARQFKKDLKKERNAKGQLAGALLQGRRYKGNTQVKKKK